MMLHEFSVTTYKGWKRPLSPVEKFIASVVAGAGILQELTNPNPSKDSHEAHEQKIQEKKEQKPQDSPRQQSLLERFTNWLKN